MPWLGRPIGQVLHVFKNPGQTLQYKRVNEDQVLFLIIMHRFQGSVIYEAWKLPVVLIGLYNEIFVSHQLRKRKQYSTASCTAH